MVLVALMAIDATGGEQVYSLARIDLRTDADLETVRSLHLDLVWQEDDYVDAVIQSDRLHILEDAGLSYSIEIEDMTAFYRNRLAGRVDGVGSMGGYRTLDEIYLAMDSIANENPTIVQPRWSIGQTLEGRDIFVMKISDNPGDDEDEAEIYYNATIHAREVITPEVLIRFMRHLTDNYGIDPMVTFLVDNREMFFTTCQNPDGYQYNVDNDPNGGGMWRKNRRDNGNGTWGVDLNRNYGYMWGYNDDGSSPSGIEETYRGTGPFSEPATQVVRDFVLTRNFNVVIAYHAWTNAILWPWGYNCSPTPEHALFLAVGQIAAQFNGYFATNCCGINGYTGDWYYGELSEKPKIYEYLVEVGGQGDGFWPPIERITPLVEENIQPNIIYALFAGDTTFLEAPAPPVLAPIGEITSLPMELNWSHEDTANPAAGFDVWRYSGFEKITDDVESVSGYWFEDGFVRSSANSHSGEYSYLSPNVVGCDFGLTATGTTYVGPNDSITFWIWYDMPEHWSYGSVEVLTGGGVWTSIPGNITTDSDPNGMNPGNGITGTSGGWVQGLFDLTEFEDEVIVYRFHVVSSEFTGGTMYVDDIYPVDRFAEVVQIAEVHPDTFFTISEIVMGDHYFQVFAVDAESQRSEGSEMELAIVNARVIGDADGSGGVDIDDVVFLINYIFGGGPAPDPLEVGDADCSGGVDIDDVVYLINYIFSGGNAPGDIDGDGMPDC
jgi:murein tripeptide amidase MpaA